jgi:hypothetical protein
MYHLKHDAFSKEYLDHVERSLLSSPYVGKSPLGPEFVETDGFSIVFRRTALRELINEFEYLREFLEAALFPKSNAFYLNPLIMKSGSRVDAHVDCRLVVTENVRIIPTLVSIFYVNAEEETGGKLTLNVGTSSELVVCPKSNDLVHFQGNLIHSVSDVSAKDVRISIVCEQYNLPESVLMGFPEYKIIQDEDLAPRVAVAN